MPALTPHAPPPSLLLFHSTRQFPTSPHPHLPLLPIPLHRPSFSLHSSSPSNPIFLSHLNNPLHQDQDSDQYDIYPTGDDAGNIQEYDEYADPLLKLPISCASEIDTHMTTRITQVPPVKPSVSRPFPEGVVGEILEIARELPEKVSMGESLDGFEGRVTEKECVEVLRFMGEEEEEEGMVRCSLYFYDWMRFQEPSLVNPNIYTVLFPIVGKAGMADELMELFGNLPDNTEFHDVQVYNAAIAGLSSCGRYADAYKVYESLESNNVSPDHMTCSMMIAIMRESGQSAKEVWEFFERMNRKGVKWSQEVLVSLIKSFCDEGLKYEALIILTEMGRKGISANAIVYNTLMDTFSKSNHVEEAEGLFAEMKAKGLKPTSATFNILMDAYSRRMQPDIIEKLLLEMQDAGLEPDDESYTCLISAYGRQKKMSDMAEDAFVRMKKVGIRPTSQSFTALIHAYSVSCVHEKAYAAFENMLREGIKPSIETYTTLLDAFRHAGDTQRLTSIWKMMMREKVRGTRVTFNILLDGLAKQGHYIEARDVIAEFGKLGLQPTVMTYNILMNAYARGGQPSKLPQLLKEMAALNLKPDSITYMTMIYAYVRVGDFKRAFFYHKMMVKSGQVPDIKSYEKLRAKLDVEAAIKNRKDKNAILGIINSKAGILKVKKKSKKDEFWKNKRKRLRYHDVAADGRMQCRRSWIHCDGGVAL